MPLNGYSVNPEGCASVLSQVEEDDARHEAVSALRNGMCAAEAACTGGFGMVAQALAEVWQDTMSLQIEAAEARIRNAAEGVRKAVFILAGADQEMAETAKAGLAELQAGFLREPQLNRAS
ncbi:DUF6507 family protein [Arthrobacter sp. Edens01]|uniref:DUF6507 family protein n=1 Tax=Arthrobacter sp. Edens01 TaxID=1732020 RepID=UPI0006DB3D1E|nr:DUF6507 family protein [Arthrobacter sp. Edens01]KPN21996.1 hypothetical protein AO716_03060 [Arthrobacter sp. Edens01]